MTVIKFLTKLSPLLLPLALSSTAVFAQEESNYTTLYENEDGDYLRQAGRLQIDSTWADGSEGEYSEIQWRRLRLGLKGQTGQMQAAFELDINLNNDASDLYRRITYAGVKWNFDNGHTLSLLKHDAKFTMDGSTSSTKLLTPQRNNLTNNLWFTAEYFTGVSMKGKLNNDWSYNAGVFSSDSSDEVSISDASYFTLFTLNRKLGATKAWDKAKITFDYVYNDLVEDSGTRDFQHVASITTKFSKGKWNLWNDVSMGIGDLGQSDLWGAVIMPFYQQNEKVQWVLRYTYLASEESAGLRLGRYENRISDVRGDTYHEAYAGVNYLFNGQKVKVHLGVQYVDMSDKKIEMNNYDGWGATLALRTYW